MFGVSKVCRLVGYLSQLHWRFEDACIGAFALILDNFSHNESCGPSFLAILQTVMDNKFNAKVIDVLELKATKAALGDFKKLKGKIKDFELTNRGLIHA